MILMLGICVTAQAHTLEADDATSVTYQDEGIWSVVSQDGSHTHWIDGTQVSEAVYDAAKAQAVEDTKDFEIALPPMDTAVAITLFDLINATRASAGQPVISKATFKGFVKDKYEEL